MLESLFTFLFKYELLVFQQGRFVFAASRPMRIGVVIAAVAAVYVIWTYHRLSAVRGRQRATLLAIRIGLLALVLFALLRPTLLLKVVIAVELSGT